MRITRRPGCTTDWHPATKIPEESSCIGGVSGLYLCEERDAMNRIRLSSAKRVEAAAKCAEALAIIRRLGSG